MPQNVDVECSDSDVRRALLDWLSRGGLNPPTNLVLAVEIVDVLPVVHDSRQIFRQPAVEIQAGPPENSAVISWNVGPARAVIPAGSRTAFVWLSRKACRHIDQCLRPFMIVVLAFLLRRVGWHHVHAGTVVDPWNRGYLIAGNSGAGKSTTTALLASHRWTVGGDDTAFLARVGPRVTVVSERLPIALREGGRALLNAGGGVFHQRREKTLYWPEDLGSAWAQRVDPDIILFPTIGNGKTTAERLGAAETLAQLVRWSAFVVLEPELAQEHLDLLSDLGRQARSFRLTLGTDLFDRPTRLMELVE